VGEDKVVARHPDGSIDVLLAVSSFSSIRSWLVGLLNHAVVMEPPAFRDDMIAWLEALASSVDGAQPPVSAGGDAAGATTRTTSATSAPAGSASSEPGLAPARSAPGAETSRRLRRLLAVVGWLAQVGEAPVADIAQRFGMSEKELVAELELAACCGTPPYTPDTLMEIEVSEHTVRAFLPAEYARPRRLTPAEGFAVAASARLLLAVPGSEDDALRRALAKLEDALGAREAVGLDVDAPADLPLIRAATEAGQNLELEYLSASRDELTTRVVEPMQVITVDGHWYLDAYCHRAGDMRRFRVDRIVKARQLDQAVSDEVRRPRPAEDMFVPGPGAYEVTLALAPGAGWVAESIPVRQVDRDGDGTVTGLVMDVAGLAWFERLLLQLGPAARVVSPPELTGLVGEAARRVLERY
jgi:predicted DNA-binding transcriptional regulator YafY